MRSMLLAGCAALGLSGCAVIDARIPGGPEQGYCVPRGNAAARNASPTFTEWFPYTCMGGFNIDYGTYGTRVGTANSFDYSLHFLRDRRRRMEDQDRQLSMMDATSRLLVGGGTAAGVAGIAFNSPHSLLLGAATAAGAGLAFSRTFTAASVRGVLAAGIEALNCVETKAHSARTISLVTQTPRSRGRAAQPQSAVDTAAVALRDALGRLQEDITALTTTATPPIPVTDPGIVSAQRALEQGRQALASLRTGHLAGPSLANRIYERTLAIINRVNIELASATPDAMQVMQLARGSAGLALNGLTDSKQAVQAAAQELKGAVAQPAMRAAAGGEATASGPATTAPGAPAANAVTAMTDLQRSALAGKAEAAGKAADDLTEALGTLGLRDSAIAQVSSCAFEQADGTAHLNMSPVMLELAAGTNGTANVTGGRGPYRVTRLPGTGGKVNEAITATPEFTTGPIAVSAAKGATGSAAFQVEDLSSRAVPPVTLTVTIK